MGLDAAAEGVPFLRKWSVRGGVDQNMACTCLADLDCGYIDKYARRTPIRAPKQKGHDITFRPEMLCPLRDFFPPFCYLFGCNYLV